MMNDKELTHLYQAALLKNQEAGMSFEQAQSSIFASIAREVRFILSLEDAMSEAEKDKGDKE